MPLSTPRARFPAEMYVVWSAVAACAALSAWTTFVYEESATACVALNRLPQPQEFCDHTLLVDRHRVVEGMAALALALLVVALLRSLRPLAREQLGSRPEPALLLGAWAGPLVGGVAVLLTAVLPGLHDEGQASLGLPHGWAHLGVPLAVPAVALLVGPVAGLSRQAAFAASAAAVPAMSAVLVAFGRANTYAPDFASSVSTTDNPVVWLAVGLLPVATLCLALALQVRGRAAPPYGLSTVLLVLSTGLTTFVVHPDIVSGTPLVGTDPSDQLTFRIAMYLLWCGAALALLAAAAHTIARPRRIEVQGRPAMGAER